MANPPPALRRLTRRFLIAAVVGIGIGVYLLEGSTQPGAKEFAGFVLVLMGGVAFGARRRVSWVASVWLRPAPWRVTPFRTSTSILNRSSETR